MRDDIAPVVDTMLVLMLVDGKIKRLTKYYSPRRTLKTTRQGKHDSKDKRMTVLVSVGSPNYAERRFIAACKKAREPFPVKKLQVKRVSK